MKRILLSTGLALCALNVSAHDAGTTGAASLSDYIYTAPQGQAITANFSV
jgi:hypothetical protein